MVRHARLGGVLLLLWGLIAGSGCASLSHRPQEENEVQVHRAVVDFLVSFERAVLAKDSDSILAHMATRYLDEQHVDFLKGNTDQFITEFFSGDSSGEEPFVSMPLHQICSLELVQLRETENGYQVIYRVWSVDTMIECEWRLVRMGIGGMPGFGLVGAWG
jgi:hypothetical protein